MQLAGPIRCGRVVLSVQQERLRSDITWIEVEHPVNGCWHTAEDEAIDAEGIGRRQCCGLEACVPPADDSEPFPLRRRAQFDFAPTRLLGIGIERRSRLVVTEHDDAHRHRE